MCLEVLQKQREAFLGRKTQERCLKSLRILEDTGMRRE
jgi:hypothetical protein